MNDFVTGVMNAFRASPFEIWMIVVTALAFVALIAIYTWVRSRTLQRREQRAAELTYRVLAERYGLGPSEEDIIAKMEVIAKTPVLRYQLLADETLFNASARPLVERKEVPAAAIAALRVKLGFVNRGVEESPQSTAGLPVGAAIYLEVRRKVLRAAVASVTSSSLEVALPAGPAAASDGATATAGASTGAGAPEHGNAPREASGAGAGAAAGTSAAAPTNPARGPNAKSATGETAEGRVVAGRVAAARAGAGGRTGAAPEGTLPVIPAGTETTIYYQNRRGSFSMSTHVVKQEGRRLFLAHTEKVEHKQLRKHYRKPVDTPVLVSTLGSDRKPAETKLIDLGGGGASLYNPRGLYGPGDDVELTIRGRPGEEIRVAGRVVRTSRLERVLHVDFVRIREADRDRIYRMLFQRRKN